MDARLPCMSWDMRSLNDIHKKKHSNEFLNVPQAVPFATLANPPHGVDENQVLSIGFYSVCAMESCSRVFTKFDSILHIAYCDRSWWL